MSKQQEDNVFTTFAQRHLLSLHEDIAHQITQSSQFDRVNYCFDSRSNSINQMASIQSDTNATEFSVQCGFPIPISVDIMSCVLRTVIEQ